MKFRTKIAIFMVSVLLTLAGFNLIASSAVDMIKIGKDAGYEMISNWQAKKATTQNSSLIKG